MLHSYNETLGITSNMSDLNKPQFVCRQPFIAHLRAFDAKYPWVEAYYRQLL